MLSKIWIYDAMIYVYALSLLFYFSDFIEKSQKAKRVGTGLLIFVWVMQTIFFVSRFLVADRVPIVTMFETVFFFSWLMVTISLLLSLVMRIDMIVLFVNIIGFVSLALNLFGDSSLSVTAEAWRVREELLFVHVSLAVVGYALLTVSALFAIMYLMLHSQLKRKRWSAWMRRLPSLETVGRYTYRSIIIGLPLLIASIALGVVWVSLEGIPSLFIDPKVLNSLLIVAAYAFYIYQRRTGRINGVKLAYWNLAAYVLAILNYLLSNALSSFHQWAGG